MCNLSQNPMGRLIAVEGVDGAGKSTQIHLLKRWLELSGKRVYLSEWNSSPLIQSATKRGKDNNLLSPTTFSTIHCADFADRYERFIWPRLQAGYLVLCDRYMYTAFARDGVRGCDPAWLRACYGFARKPDLTFYIQVPLQTALDRILFGRPTLKFHEAGMDLNLSTDPYESFALFQGRVGSMYEAMVPEFGLIGIDGNQNIQMVQEELRTQVASSFDLEAYSASPLS